MAENKNIGSTASVMKSKSCHDRIQVVSAMPAPANAYPMTTAAGAASSVHHERVRPSDTMTTTNMAAYSPPRSSDHTSSPTTTSNGRSGVASTES